MEWRVRLRKTESRIWFSISSWVSWELYLSLFFSAWFHFRNGRRERGREGAASARAGKKVFFVPCSLSLSVSILGKRMEQKHAFSFVLMTYTHFFLPIFYWYFLPFKIEKNNSISWTSGKYRKDFLISSCSAVYCTQQLKVTASAKRCLVAVESPWKIGKEGEGLHCMGKHRMYVGWLPNIFGGSGRRGQSTIFPHKIERKEWWLI